MHLILLSLYLLIRVISLRTRGWERKIQKVHQIVITSFQRLDIIIRLNDLTGK